MVCQGVLAPGGTMWHSIAWRFCKVRTILTHSSWQKLRDSPNLLGSAYGLAAATLFGISPPMAKLLLPEAGPLLIAGLLYLGAGVGLLVFELLFSRSLASRRESRIGPADRWLLAGIIVSGGILGPFCMLWGLQRLSAVLGALLLNLEAPFTIGLAVLFFREHLGRRGMTGSLLIVTAAAILQFHPEELRPDPWGFLAIVAACFWWAIDNNFSQRLSLRDPIIVTRIKALGAAACTLTMAFLEGQNFPAPSILVATLMLGLFSYGMSLVFDMQALRLLGAAREAGFFATAPFVGAAAAVPILGEQWGINEVLASLIMVIGVTLLFREHHHHVHVHEEIEHDHVHLHGLHHEHEHVDGQEQEPHTHLHRHLPLIHDHPHASELHHRHEHK
jgi:drug/metabolite transporter (DMT)-like permease